MTTKLAALSGFKQHFRRFGRRLVAVRSAWVAVALVIIVIASDALYALPSSVRAGAMAAVAVVIAAIAATTSVLLRRSQSFDRMVARKIEDSDPRMGNVLVNAIDFEQRLRAGGHGGAEELMRSEIARAEELARRVKSVEALRPPTYRRERTALGVLAAAALVLAIVFWHVVAVVVPRLLLPYADFPPYSPTKFSVAPGAVQLDYGQDLKVTVTASGKKPDTVALVLWDAGRGELAELPMFNAGGGEFFQTLENLREDTRYFARAGRGRSKRYPITINTKPRIESIIVEYEYPAYTRKATETRTLADGVVRGYPNTKVTFAVRSNRPLASGAIRTEGASASLVPAEQQTVRGELVLTVAGAFSIDVTDTAGNAAKDAAGGTIEILPDAAPAIVISSPGMDSFAVPDAKVPIEINAQDDFGIANVSLYRNHNGSDDARKGLYDGEEGRGTLTVVEVLDLGALGVRAGDMIEYYATSTDNQPGAPQTAATPAYRLQIISHEEYRDYMQTQMTAEDLKEYYDAILDDIQELAKQQSATEQQTSALEEELEKASGAPPGADERLDQLRAEQQRLAAAASQLAEQLRNEAAAPGVYDIENSYKEALREFADRIEEAREHMKNAEGQMGAPGTGLPTALSEQREALAKLGAVSGEFQNGIQRANEHLENVMNVVADTENFKYLYTLQKGLERQIRYYRDKVNPTLDDQIRLKELSEQQREVMQALAQLKQELRAHADDLDALAREQEPEEATVP